MRFVAEIDGVAISAASRRPGHPDGAPLIAALHGGCYTGDYFDVAAPDGESFVDLAVDRGYHVVSFDRPGYGASDGLPADENTFERQAELLGAAISQLAEQSSTPAVVLVGHSIGGMIALTIAAQDVGFPLVGVSATGMGAVIPPGGAAEGLAAMSQSAGIEVIALAPEESDGVMFGPPWTFDPEILEAAHSSYAPAPVVEPVAAPKWAAEKLPALAPRITVPVHNALAEFDALWDSSPQSIELFRSMLSAAPSVDASVALGTGHSIDHHRLGRALHLRQIAFADECVVLAHRRD